jgi:succinate dehydrogenase flavin-adding protein (antitoxin of CptAB toxin-antitoxin module)
MKKKTFTKISSFQDEEFEKLLAEKDAELKALARRIGKTLAERKLPNASGDRLISYLGEIKAGYEKLCAFCV